MAPTLSARDGSHWLIMITRGASIFLSEAGAGVIWVDNSDSRTRSIDRFLRLNGYCECYQEPVSLELTVSCPVRDTRDPGDSNSINTQYMVRKFWSGTFFQIKKTERVGDGQPVSFLS